MTTKAPVRRPLTEGMKAPLFSGVTDQETPLLLKTYRGKAVVVLYFYPKDDTPGCTREACGFQRTFNSIRRTGAAVIGVSRDSSASHRRFKAKYGLKFPLIADVDASLCKRYGVFQMKSFMGKSHLGIVRTTFLIGRDGLIKKIFHHVKADGHEREVLAALKALNASPSRDR